MAASISALPSLAEGPSCLASHALARSIALFSSVELLVMLQVFLFSSSFSRRSACASVVELLADTIVADVGMCVRVDQLYASYFPRVHYFLQLEWDRQEDLQPAGRRGTRPLMPQQRD